MSRPPQYDITLDGQRADTSLRDLQRADASIVRMAEAQQHALMSGWGTPPTCFTWSNFDYGDAVTMQFPLRVPPYCRRFRVLTAGFGFAAFSLQVGTLPAVNFTWLTHPESLREFFTTTVSTETVAEYDVFLQAVETLAPTWQTVAVTFTWDYRMVFVPGGHAVHSMAFYPIPEPAV